MRSGETLNELAMRMNRIANKLRTLSENLNEVKVMKKLLCIGRPELRFERLPQVFGRPHMQICVNQLISNHAQNCPEEHDSGLLERLLLFRSDRSCGSHTGDPARSWP